MAEALAAPLGGDKSKAAVFQVDAGVKLHARLANKEAAARIKINKLLESAGWRFFQALRV